MQNNSKTPVFHKRSPLWSITLFFFATLHAFSGSDAIIPSIEVQNKLVKASILDFSKAVVSSDFTAFHANLSKPFKEQFSAKDLQKVFKVFIDQKMDLSMIDSLTPIYNQPTTIDKDGVITITGFFNTSPNTAFFELIFYEYPNWKLLSIDVRVKDSPLLRMPSSEVQLGLVQSSIKGFAKSINTKDFNDFHRTLCTNFSQQYTAADLKNAFQTFIDKDIDLLPLADLTPIFHQAPFLDEDDVLTIIGHYTTEPSQTNFVLKYFERPAWKLLSINVNIN